MTGLIAFSALLIMPMSVWAQSRAFKAINGVKSVRAKRWDSLKYDSQQAVKPMKLIKLIEIIMEILRL